MKGQYGTAFRVAMSRVEKKRLVGRPRCKRIHFNSNFCISALKAADRVKRQGSCARSGVL